MSTYFPKSMALWKIQKGLCEEVTQADTLSKVLRHKSQVIHSLNSHKPSKDSQKCHQLPVRVKRSHIKAKSQMRSSGGFKTFKSSVEQTSRSSMRYQYRSVPNENMTKSAVFGPNSSQTFRRNGKDRRSTDHKKRQRSTLSHLENQGIPQIMVIMSKQPELQVNRVKENMRPSYFIQENPEPEFSPYRHLKLKTQRQNTGNQIQKQISKQNTLKTVGDQSDGGCQFLFVQESQIHFRSTEASRNGRDKMGVDEWQARRKKKLQKAQHLRLQYLPITPWNTTEYID